MCQSAPLAESRATPLLSGLTIRIAGTSTCDLAFGLIALYLGKEAAARPADLKNHPR
jgi:hypothetical protein